MPAGFLISGLTLMLQLLLLLPTSSVGAGASDERLTKRSDDINSLVLQEVVRQQAVMIQNLVARVTALENRDAEREGNITAIAQQLGVKKQVAFSVSFQKNSLTLDIHQRGPIKFDTIVTNIGGAYDNSTGIFTAPVPGLYAFFAAVRNDNVHRWTYVGIMKNDQATVLARTIVEGSSDGVYDKGYCYVTAHLQRGDRIFLAHVMDDGSGTSLERGYLTNFSGVLIAADL